jgi:inosine-uridine nucleoside N-ribohydrolase
LGAGGRDGSGPQQGWADRFAGGKSRVKIVDDGVGAMIRIIRESPEPVTIISIGPSTTVSAALERDPDIASKAVFVGMQGAVRKGYDGGPVGPEYNVKENVPAAKRALLAPWRRTVITPLDTCGLVRLKGELFKALGRSRDPLVEAILENYRIWAGKKSISDLFESSVLFDTVAVYLALPGAKSFLELEDFRIGITPEGLTAIDAAGAKMSVATSWSDLESYEDFLVKRLLK